jgi:cystathionine beta-synthase
MSSATPPIIKTKRKRSSRGSSGNSNSNGGKSMLKIEKNLNVTDSDHDEKKTGTPTSKKKKVTTTTTSTNMNMNLDMDMDIDTRTSIAPSILSCIGKTPLVQLNHIPKSDDYKDVIQCQIVAKCEFFNAGGSVKDRIGLQMILDAEKKGRIKPGDTLIEPTSGNTGIGLALASAVKGYKCIIVLPEKMSKEKVDVLKALGAEIVRTPTEAAYDAPDSHISVAKRLKTEIQNSHILDQYKNESNPNAHYYGTAEEIWEQCDHKVDMLVAGAGTGGTISGIARKLKKYNPNIIIVGVDPAGSILAQPDTLNEYKKLEPYAVEGIGYDFIPQVLDRSLIDKWYKSNDTDSLVMMRRLIRDEGLLCGGSCGSAMSIALKAVQDFKLTKDQRCVVILPDSVRNYMTKALSDDWMLDHSFIDNDVIKPKKLQTWWADHFVRDIPLATPLTITSDVTCKAAISLLKQEGFDMVPVIGENGSVIGVVTEGNMSSQILSGRVKSDIVSVEEANVIYKTFRKIGLNAKLADLAHALDLEPFVLVVTEQRCFNVENKIQTKMVVSGIVTRIDLLDFISKGGEDGNGGGKI